LFAADDNGYIAALVGLFGIKTDLVIRQQDSMKANVVEAIISFIKI